MDDDDVVDSLAGVVRCGFPSKGLEITHDMAAIMHAFMLLLIV